MTTLKNKSGILKSSNSLLINFFSSYIQKFLKIYQLNVTKKTKKDCQKARERYKNPSKG